MKTYDEVVEEEFNKIYDFINKKLKEVYKRL